MCFDYKEQGFLLKILKEKNPEKVLKQLFR